jgi:hypothetical protein
VRTSTTFHVEVRSEADPSASVIVPIRVEPPAGLPPMETKQPPPVDFLEMPSDPRSVVAGYAPEMRLLKMPFLDLATGHRWTEDTIRDTRTAKYDELPKVVARVTPWGDRVAGLGVPFELECPRLRPAKAAVLTIQDARGCSYRDASEGPRIELTLSRSARIRVEALSPVAGADKTWDSQVATTEITARGLQVLAGDPHAAPGYRDGTGMEARFEVPAGIVWVHGRTPDEPGVAVVTEPGRNCLRFVHPDGRVEKAWGDPDGPPGLAPGGPAEARFNRPTRVIRWEGPELGPGGLLISDSGNNVIRGVTLGLVATFAGRAGDHPFHNGKTAEATFRNPQGLAMDRRGVFVADQGFRVLRWIDRSGQVTTFAGKPGEQGILDGKGEGARFWDLRGLDVDVRNHDLWVLDGNALRRIRPDGRVETVAGSVLRAGFQDQGRPGEPCFNDPQDLFCRYDQIYIADTGNNAIREVDVRDALDRHTRDINPARVRVRTVAGDRDRPLFQEGLYKDALRHFPAEGYATVAAPRALSRSDGSFASMNGMTVAGACLAVLPEIEPRLALAGPPSGPEAAPTVTLRPEAPAAGQAYRIGFTVPRQPGMATDYHAPIAENLYSSYRNLARAWDFHYTVEILDPNGQPVARPIQGHGFFNHEMHIHSDPSYQVDGVPFPAPGVYTLVVRYVTVAGYSADTVRTVTVAEP